MSYGVTSKYNTCRIAHSVLTRNIYSVDMKHKWPNKNDQYCIIIASIFHNNRYNISLQYYRFHYNIIDVQSNILVLRITYELFLLNM